jgi:hypothetical protein
MRTFLFAIILIPLLSIQPLFALTLSDFKSLSTTAQSELQYNLRALNYDIGPVDGKIGRKSFTALKQFSDSNGQDLNNISLDELLKDIEQQAMRMLRKQKRILPKTFDFKVTFAMPSELKQFEHERITNCEYGSCSDGFTPIEFLQEPNSNTFLALGSKEGLRSNLANNAKNPSDRQELGTRSVDADLEGTVLWYGFRIKYPKNFTSQNSKGITFTQVKEVTKWRDPNNRSTKINCSKGVVFHAQVQNKKSGFGGLYNGDGMHYPKRVENIKLISKKWTTYKVGIAFSRTKKGWIEVYQNGRLIWRDVGDNLITQYNGNCPRGINWRTAYLRIGVYRSNSPKGQDTLHFDDFVASHSERVVDDFLH